MPAILTGCPGKESAADTMNQYVFEEISEKHLPEVREIYNHYVLNTTCTFNTHALSLDEMKRMVFFDDQRYKTFVLTEDNSVCGYVFLKPHSEREAYDKTAEVTVYLKPGLIGKGLGSMCIRYIEKHAKVNAFHALLAVICGENEKSIRLFERNGYKKCAHYREIGEKFGRFLDVVVYQKILE
jgi:L-amino acid N-acyltransferase YncA